jgi:CSLREA domain-containing protein
MKKIVMHGIRFLVLAALIAGLGWRAQPVQAVESYYVVNSNGDYGDANPGNLICADAYGWCTLRAAIQEINASGLKNAIVISDMPVDTFSINSPLQINRAMTITGLGKDITKIQYNGVPVGKDGMIVAANLTLNDLTLRNFTDALNVYTAGLVINISNSRISESKTALNLMQYSTVNFNRSIIEKNGGSNSAVSSMGGQINLNDSSVINNESGTCGAITIRELGSSLTAHNSVIASNRATSTNGGAICNIGGSISLTDTFVSGNTARSNGGGIYQDGGQLLISGSSQVNNNSADQGGGIYSKTGSVIIRSELTFMPQINGNSAVRLGGGLYLSGDGEFELTGVLIQNNSVDNSSNAGTGQGGGVYYFQDTLQRGLTIYNSVISNNQIIQGSGGGISVTGKTAYVFINNTTISGNQSTVNGGGIIANHGILIFSNVTVTNNTCNSDSTGGGQGGGIYRSSAAAVTIRNSIIAGNHDLKGYSLDFYAPDIDGMLISDGYNLIGNINGWVSFTGNITGNIVNMDPGLNALAEGVAPQINSPHHALQASSPAVNGGNPAGCRDYTGRVMFEDQLGNLRSLAGRCDIGAVESAFEPVIILIDVSAAPTTVTGGNAVTGTVTLNQMAPSGGTIVNLSSNKPDASVPATVSIPAGAYSQTFTIQTSAVTTDTLATISAGLGSLTRTVVLVLRAQDAQPVLVELTLTPSSVPGGTSVAAAVTLDRAAPIGGTAVSVTSDLAEATVPAVVTVPAGSSTQSFTVQTTAVPMNILVTLSASLNSVTRTAVLVVRSQESQPALVALTLNPGTVNGGDSLTAIVTLDSAAPAGGTTIAITSDQPEASVPAVVTVPVGVSEKTFTVQTTDVPVNTLVTLSASLESVNKTAILIVKPAGRQYVFLPLAVR